MNEMNKNSWTKEFDKMNDDSLATLADNVGCLPFFLLAEFEGLTQTLEILRDVARGRGLIK